MRRKGRTFAIPDPSYFRWPDLLETSELVPSAQVSGSSLWAEICGTLARLRAETGCPLGSSPREKAPPESMGRPRFEAAIGGLKAK